MRTYVTFLALMISFSSCNKEEYFAGPNSFQDDFEEYEHLEDLLIDGDELWSFTQLTRVANGISVDTLNYRSGSQSLKFTAEKTTDGKASKASIAKQHMAFWEDETVRMTAWYYIDGTDSLNWLFLMDLEEQTAIGAGPGIRLALVENQLRIEHKFYEDDVLQSEETAMEFPRNEWVEIVWEVRLSVNSIGFHKLWQNDQLIIESNANRTLPKDFLYFQQGTKAMYSSFEIGITANSADNNLIVWLDDISIERVE